MTEAADLRRRIHRLLLDGNSVPKAARALDIGRSLAHYHAKALEQAGAIKRHPGSQKSPILYTRGPQADAYEAGLDVQTPDRLGRSVARSPARVHRGRYNVALDDAPSRQVPWERTWEASGVRYAKLHLDVGGRRYRFQLNHGARRVSLTVDPPEELVSDPDEVAQVEHTRLRAALLASRAFCRRYGATMRGRMRSTQPVEYGWEVPGLKRHGVPGVDPVWVDTSPGESRPELETNVREIAHEVQRLPDTRRVHAARLERHEVDLEALHARLDAIEQGLDGQALVLERVVSVQERQEGVSRAATAAVVRALPGPEFA